ncbi:hypothetical protein TPHA_0A02580 [Tetrapisispora phaffii CBS 4417]|uniref:SANT domain-containing protein n=1 Tax=Tetrapisispora phaffii (strain ATCC 24235 / CBS 4417 / NBRC 1672 / NRRL Y-8282 / UCD 70-5) TaxID=1071381 RepID=G8BN63_TETPH|nr:hypothetical protein TPHA_0A02580 [Tetrapisispora phaffii CBS 4417]CCE61341.1 hypothetical protein TPHA_0A02580 [Tetrapisispora phaffii CBS 4417]
MVDSSIISSNSPKKNEDKKRYYYSNSSSNITRPNSHGNPNNMHLYSNNSNNSVTNINKKYPYYNHPNSHGNSTPLSTNESINQHTKQSRYDPNSINRPSSTSRLTGSRYNPEEKSQLSQTISNPATNSQPISIGNNSNINVSRYSGSRYNPQPKPNHYNNNATGVNSIASGQVNIRNRPKSTDPVVSRNSSHTYRNSSATNVTGYNDLSKDTQFNSQRNSLPLQNKWKTTYSPLGKTSTDQSFTTNHDGYENDSQKQQNHYNNNTSRNNSWKSARVAKSLTSSYVAPSPKRYNPNPVTNLTSSLEASNQSQTTTPITTAPLKISSNVDQQETNKDMPSNDDQDNSFAKYSITEVNSKEQSQRYIPSLNPHSLGSSLINSVKVPEKITKPLHNEQVIRKGSIKKVSKSEEQYIDIEYKSEQSGTSSPVSTKRDSKVFQGGDNLRKRSLSASKTPNRSSGFLWSQADENDTLMTNDVNDEKSKLINNIFKQDYKHTGDIEKLDEESKLNDKSILKKQLLTNYNYIFDPKVLKTDFDAVRKNLPLSKGYTTPLTEIDSCIFPMGRAETKLWELKNQKRDDIISEQKYLLKTPLKAISDYPFIDENKLLYKQAVRPTLSTSISKTKKYERLRKVQLKKQFIDLKNNWVKTCDRLDSISNKLRSEEIAYKKKLAEEEEERLKAEKELLEEQKKASGSSRRRNRADFVDDTDMESVLLQIDPNYKHFKIAATIPPMIIDPIEKYSMKFKDVNNLITDKDQWSSRVLSDGIDNFTEYEHELFVEGYLSYPKKFGKISNHMGNLRTPEECVLHYYRTKKKVNYKKLIIEKNKKRKGGVSKKKTKKKEKSNEITDTNEDTTMEAEQEQPSNIKEETLHDNDKEEIVVENEEIISKEENSISNEEIVTNEQNTDTNDNGIPNETSSINNVKSTYVEPATMEQGIEKTDATVNPEITAHPITIESSIEGENKPVPNNEFPDLANSTNSRNETEIQESNKRNFEEVVYTSGTEPKYPHNNQYHADYEHYSKLDENAYDASSKKKFKPQIDHKSSYWSVKEANLFPDLLKQYGSQWILISNALGTKSTTMVRNYYQRNAAQQGWKLIVEEADSKLNATSSGSVQQSQILIQAGQQQTNAAVMYSQNGVPIQQKPALGFFSNTDNEGANSSTTALASTAQPFSQESAPKDIFSSVSSTGITLPPPRLPSIQLGRPSIFPQNGQYSGDSHVPSQLPPSRFSSVSHQSNRISDLLNSKTPDVASANTNAEASPINSSITNDSSKQIFTEARPASQINTRPLISSLLNYESNQPDMKAVTNRVLVVPSTIPISPMQLQANTMQPPQLPALNFNTDPLAALAAIASASENMSPLLTKNTTPSSSAQDSTTQLKETK